MADRESDSSSLLDNGAVAVSLPVLTSLGVFAFVSFIMAWSVPLLTGSGEVGVVNLAWLSAIVFYCNLLRYQSIDPLVREVRRLRSEIEAIKAATAGNGHESDPGQSKQLRS